MAPAGMASEGIATPGPGAHHGMVGAVFQDLDVGIGEHQHGALHIAGQQHVAATAH